MKTFKSLLRICIYVFLSIMPSNCGLHSKHPDTQCISSLWQKIGPGGGGSTFIPTFSYHSANNFLVRCDMTGTYLTRNGGSSYYQINFSNGSSCFAYDPIDSNTIYIGSTFLSQSRDGGKSWERVFPTKNEIESDRYIGDHAEYEMKTIESSLYVKEVGKIESILVDPVDKRSLYFTMGSFFFYSENSGQSWKRQELNYQIDNLYTNQTSAKNEVYIFSREAIYVFDKTSKKFTSHDIPKAMSPALSFTAGTIKKSDKPIFYALHHLTPKENDYTFTNSEIWTSENFGASWNPSKDVTITNEKSGLKPCFTMVVCSENDAENAYIVTNNYEVKNKDKTSSFWYGVLKTGDAGKSWNWVWKGGGGSGEYGVKDAEDASNLMDAWVHKAFGGEFIQLMDVGVSPQDGKIAVVTDWYRTMKTMDGGKTWKEIYSISNSNETYTTRGMDVTTTYGVHFDPFDKNHLGISYTDIGYHQSFDGGKSWSRSVEGVPNEWVNTCYWVVFDPKIKDRVWSAWSGMHDFPRGKMTRNPKWKDASYAKGGICVSNDGGRTWKPTVNGMGMNSPSTCIVLDPKSAAENRTLYVSVFNKGVFKSTDDGKTWSLKNKGIESNTNAFELTLAGNGNLFLTVSPSPVFKDGKKGKEIYSGAVYRSNDGAETWTKLKVSNGLLFPNGMAADLVNPNILYLGCWSTISLSDLVGSDVARSTGGNTMLEMPGGIFKSEDGGNTWKSIFDQKQYVYDVTVDPYHPGRLFCNTFNKSAWRSDDSGKTWGKIKDYDFHWGHRIIVDQNNPEKVYITTFGSSVWHGIPKVE
jgi:hypothetical protein